MFRSLSVCYIEVDFALWPPNEDFVIWRFVISRFYCNFGWADEYLSPVSVSRASFYTGSLNRAASIIHHFNNYHFNVICLTWNEILIVCRSF